MLLYLITEEFFFPWIMQPINNPCIFGEIPRVVCNSVFPWPMSLCVAATIILPPEYAVSVVVPFLSRHNVPHPLALLPPPSCMGTFKRPRQRTTTNAECHKTVRFKEQSNGFALTLYFLLNFFADLCKTTTQSDQF